MNLESTKITSQTSTTTIDSDLTTDDQDDQGEQDDFDFSVLINFLTEAIVENHYEDALSLIDSHLSLADESEKILLIIYKGYCLGMLDQPAEALQTLESIKTDLFEPRFSGCAAFLYTTLLLLKHQDAASFLQNWIKEKGVFHKWTDDQSTSDTTLIEDLVPLLQMVTIQNRTGIQILPPLSTEPLASASEYEPVSGKFPKGRYDNELIKRGRYEEALEYCRSHEGILFDTESPEIFCLAMLGRFDEAIKMVSSSASLEATFLIKMLYMMEGKYVSAESVRPSIDLFAGMYAWKYAWFLLLNHLDCDLFLRWLKADY